MLATKEKSHPRFQLSPAALHPGFGFAISNTAISFQASVYDFCGGPRSSGYFRDSETGLDYAKNRYHQPGMGRFLTPDPYMASGGPGDPGSWNRYAYAGGDPIKYKDPSGREQCDPDEGDSCGGFCDPCDPASDCYDPTCDCSGSGTGPSTQGGTKKKTIKITNVSTISKQAQTVQNDLQALKGLIDANQDCFNWLNSGGGNPDDAITFILGQGLGATGVTAGVGNFNGDTANAVEGTGGTTLPYGSMNITVNTNGAFFNSSVGVGYGLTGLTGGTLAAQYEILLHELAHFTQATNFVGNDSSQAAQTFNNAAVMANCGTIVNGAKGQ